MGKLIEETERHVDAVRRAERGYWRRRSERLRELRREYRRLTREIEKIERAERQPSAGTLPPGLQVEA